MATSGELDVYRVGAGSEVLSSKAPAASLTLQRRSGALQLASGASDSASLRSSSPAAEADELRAEVEALRRELEASRAEAAFYKRQAEANAAVARDEAALVDAAVHEARISAPSSRAHHRCSLDGASAAPTASQQQLAAVRFSCRADRLPLLGRSGARLVLAGCTESLGGWSADRAQPMQRSRDGRWVSDLILLPAGSLVAYKYVLITAGGNVVWQSGGDNILAVRKTETALEVNDDWSSEEELCTVVSWSLDAPHNAGAPHDGGSHHGGRAERRKERLQGLIEEMQRGLSVSSTAVAAAAGAAKGAVSAWPRAKRAHSAPPPPPPAAAAVPAVAAAVAAAPAPGARQPSSGASRRALLLASARPKKNRAGVPAPAAAAVASPAAPPPGPAGAISSR